MAAIPVLTVYVGTPRVGGWCPICLLPTAYEADLLALTEDGVKVVGVARGCTEGDDNEHFLKTGYGRT